ncbi:uncharacterized protein LOC100371097 [Saccoglossus kowalevskii]|uniref:Uncharacterized protein CXorf65 homolog n=1 Tax=Saccoglossus kowalevskii TaxID=10224 RepID=A0ABM0GM53_SACKO|nr:PREDICTED: uncharacterized protein CXorf65 homolog [Saccoglossus kowalevskii]
MFITVKFGDGKSEIFNPNCRNAILLHNIKERCDCDIEDMVELSDETGNVMHLLTNPADYGKQYLTERTAFILLRVEREDSEGEEERLTYHPLLRGMDTNKDFLERLNPKPVLPKPSQETGNLKGKDNKMKNDDSVDVPLNSKDSRRRGVSPAMASGGGSRANKQVNALKRGGSRAQLGRR